MHTQNSSPGSLTLKTHSLFDLSGCSLFIIKMKPCPPFNNLARSSELDSEDNVCYECKNIWFTLPPAVLFLRQTSAG